MSATRMGLFKVSTNDFQDVIYYSAPKSQKKLKDLRRVRIT
jgi:hypothetical protein